MQAASRPASIAPLTSLRFFAALLVFVHHTPLTARWSEVFSLGFAGVGFFFVLSGFILTIQYHEDFFRGFTWARLHSFYVARVARVYPLHVVTMLIVLAFFLAGGVIPDDPTWTHDEPALRLRAVLAQTFLLQSWIPDLRINLAINGPSWSISDEAFFYACFPLLVFGLSALLRRWSPRGLYALALTACVAHIVAVGNVRLVSRPGEVFWPLYGFPPTRLVDFVLGIVMALAFLRRDRMRGLLSATSVEILAVGAVGIAIICSVAVPQSLRFSAWLLPWWALLISVFARQAGALSHALTHAVFVRLGEASFAFYLVHLVCVAEVSRAGFSPGLSFLVALVMSMVAAIGLFHVIEQPMRVRLRAALTGGGQHTASPVGASPFHGSDDAVAPGNERRVAPFGKRLHDGRVIVDQPYADLAAPQDRAPFGHQMVE